MTNDETVGNKTHDDTCGACWGSGWETQFITPCRECKGTGKIAPSEPVKESAAPCEAVGEEKPVDKLIDELNGLNEFQKLIYLKDQVLKLRANTKNLYTEDQVRASVKASLKLASKNAEVENIGTIGGDGQGMDHYAIDKSTIDNEQNVVIIKEEKV